MNFTKIIPSPNGYKNYNHSLLVELDEFSKREFVASYGYWLDPDWDKARNLREQGKISESNNLIFEIRKRWGISQ